MPLDLLSTNDPLLAGVAPEFLHAFDLAKASSHISGYNRRNYSAAQIFVGDALVKLWGRLMGGAHLLTDARIALVVKALAEYSPKQIADAIRAYAQHCRTDVDRLKKPFMRKTFERLLADGLETWIVVGSAAVAGAANDQRKCDELREHNEFLAVWLKLPDAEQSRLLRQAGSQFSGVNPTTSNPAFRRVLRSLMASSSQPSAISRQPAESKEQTGECLPDSIEQLHNRFYAMDQVDRQLLIQKAAKQLEKIGYFAGNTAHMGNPKIRTRVYQILQRERKTCGS